MDTQENCVGMTDFSCDSPHVEVTKTNQKEVPECDKCLQQFGRNPDLTKHKKAKSDCRSTGRHGICKGNHEHQWDIQKFGDLEEARTHARSYGEAFNIPHKNGSTWKAYCKDRPHGCNGTWGITENRSGEYVFRGCLAHQSTCTPSVKGRRHPRSEVKKRVRPKKFSCDKCEFKGINIDALKKHIKSVHEKIKDIVCQLCDYTCSLKGSLDSHIKSVHLKLKNYICEECGYSTFQKNCLRIHQQSVHLNMRSYVCEQCAMAFNRKSSLNKHKQVVHLKIKKHVCQYCGYATALSGNLKKHKATVHKMQN